MRAWGWIRAPRRRGNARRQRAWDAAGVRRTPSIWLAAGAVLPLALLGAALAGAQTFAGVARGGWMSSWPDGPPAMRLSPSGWVDRRGVGFTLGGSLARGLPGNRPPGAGLEGGAVEIAAWGSRHRYDGVVGALSARIHRTRPGAGVWLATSALASDEGAGETLPLLGGGLWTQRGRLTITAQLVQLLRPVLVRHRAVALPVSPPDSEITGRQDPRTIPLDDLRLLTGAETSVAWTMGRLELQSRAGVAVGARQRPARWGELGAAFWARPGVALFARARSAAGIPAALEAVRGSQAALGVELAPARQGTGGTRSPGREKADALLERLGDGRCRIVLHAAGRSLELCGDDTGWSPVSARRIASRSWEVVLALGPGVHRMAMRVDGGDWKPLPGFPTTVDEFGGEVALVVVD